MARLEIRILGPFEAAMDGEPVSGFDADSTRALVAYLATEPGRRWPRPAVAEMFWPERREGAALSNLRHSLSVLRRVLGNLDGGPGALVADRNTVAVADDVWVDLVEFERLAATEPESPEAAEDWEEAVGLWRGPLLDGLRVRSGAEWEEWLVVTSERIRREMAAVLQRLADHYERSAESKPAIEATQRLTEIDPWDERAHRQLMRLLAGVGESPKALAHFVALEKTLLADLGAPPAPETVALADTIRAGNLAAGTSPVEIAYPSFLAKPATHIPPLFVGRDSELRNLHSHLEAALAGRGRVVFIAGEAGSGKTVLATEFMRRATEVPDLLVARGRCNAFGGYGDPYLPFRDVLGLLCGDVESDYTAGTLDREQATRLWEAIPHSARLVSQLGPSLVGVMVNGALLVDRGEQAVAGAEWIESLRELAQRPPAAERVQPALFDEFVAVLERLSVTHPLLLVVDDLQWADQGTIALLWHLARRVGGMRALIVAAYRPEEVTPDPDGPSSLSKVLADLRAMTPDCVVELGGDREFVDELLDSEPNALSDEFRARLYSYTGGHPLFTVELVRGMQERAELRRDRTGVWGVRGSLDWDRLPSRVEAAIAQRIARLPDVLQRDLTIASVQGEEFVAEIVAAVRSDGAAPLRLSRVSGAPHRLI